MRQSTRAHDAFCLFQNVNIKKCSTIILNCGLVSEINFYFSYFNSPYDRNNTYDVLRVFEQLSSQFVFTESHRGYNSQMKELKNLLGRHQNFSQITVESLVKTINLLQTQCSNETILKNSHLAFYSK